MTDGNVFGRTRRQLTFYYSAVMAVFFVLLVVLVHRTMEWSVSSEQARELLDTAADTAYAQAAQLERGSFGSEEKFDFQTGRDRLFFYAFDEDGTLLDFSRASVYLEPTVIDIIRNWDSEPEEVMLLDRQVEGRLFRIMMTAHPVVLEEKPVGMVFVGKDVTTIYSGLQKATHAMVVMAFIALLIATAAGHIMAGKAIVPLRNAYEKQRQFAADASHELRTPLAVVMTSVDLLDNDPSIKTPFLKQVLEDMRDEVRKMTKLVADLLFVARNENRAIQLNRTEFDITAAAMHTMRMMQPLADEKSIALSVDNQDSLMVKADEEKVRQLMLILVDNAIKYTNDGGRVTVCARRVDKLRFSFAVQDTGIGIPQSDLANIFERFYRVDKARSREMGGNGLGLAIAHELAELHHGNIRVESKLGEGSTFTVTLREN